VQRGLFRPEIITEYVKPIESRNKRGEISKEFHPNTRGDVVWVCRKYFSWDEGHADLTVTSTAQIREFGDGVPVELIYDNYRKKVGLPRNANDGKGFHSLRRTLGRELITNNVPITTAAQILGHANICDICEWTTHFTMSTCSRRNS
jgi:hypothetical protein